MTGEFDLIKRHLLGAGNRRPGRIDGYPSGMSPGSGVLLHAGDDAALLEPSPEKGVSVSVDTSLSMCIFRRMRLPMPLAIEHWR